MCRRGFTLMEMLVSVVLIVLITLFMYGAIASSRLTSRTLSEHATLENNRTQIYELLYRDIMEALWVKPQATKDSRFTVVQMQTRNSLYDIAAPHVAWYVNAQSRELIRLESAQTIDFPVSYEQKVFIHADVFAKEVQDFNLMTASNEKEEVQQTSLESNTTVDTNGTGQTAPSEHFEHFLLYLNTAKMPPMLLELAL